MNQICASSVAIHNSAADLELEAEESVDEEDDGCTDFRDEDLPGSEMHQTLIRKFMTLTCLSLIILNGLLITLVLSANYSFVDRQNNALEGQVNSQVGATLNEAGVYFIAQLNKYEESVINVMKRGHENVMRKSQESHEKLI